jgi:hypothetical protein
MDPNLFIYFSPDATENPDGKAPFHDEIAEFAEGVDREGFREFFEERYRWHWYPIITHRFSSFPCHADLNGVLTEDGRHRCIGYCAEICAEEEGKRFVSAIGSLAMLCTSCKTPTEAPALTEHFMQIRKTAGEFPDDPNVSFWFSKVVVFQIATKAVPKGYTGSFDRPGMNAPEKE